MRGVKHKPHVCACGNSASVRRAGDWICARCLRIERERNCDAAKRQEERLDGKWWEETDRMIADGMNRVLKRRKTK